MNKKSITFASGDIIRQLKVLNQERESIGSKLAITAKNLALVAKEKERVRKKLAQTARVLKTKAKNLANIAKEKESVKHKLEIVAKNLAEVAKEKEVVRKKLAAAAAVLKIKDEQLVSTTKEMEAFSYSVSHDLRAPLQVIDGFAQILVKNYATKLDDEGKRVVLTIHSSAKQMAKLIEDLLAFSHLGRQEITKQSVAMGVLVDQVYQQLHKTCLERAIEFTLPALPDAKADLEMMRVVWTNLISNAIKFTAKTEHARIKVGFKSDQKEITYYVKDNGAGFNMQYLDKLFGVFVRLHSAEEFEGTGVGLANVKRIVERHGGRVWAEGQVGQGATIYFSLPN